MIKVAWVTFCRLAFASAVLSLVPCSLAMRPASSGELQNVKGMINSKENKCCKNSGGSMCTPTSAPPIGSCPSPLPNYCVPVGCNAQVQGPFANAICCKKKGNPPPTCEVKPGANCIATRAGACVYDEYNIPITPTTYITVGYCRCDENYFSFTSPVWHSGRDYCASGSSGCPWYMWGCP